MSARRTVARALALSLILASGCRGRPRSWDVPVEADRPRATGPAVLELDLASGAPESEPGGLLRIPSRHTFDALVAALHQAQTRKDLKGVFVAFATAPIGWARGRELGDALAAIKKRGVPVVCHADAWDNATYAAAARGCDTIAVSPSGEVELTGPSATVPYARELLVDKLRAQVDLLQVGKFKGAAEPLTRDGPSAEYRESIEGALSSIDRAWRASLGERGVSELAGTGPYAAEEARAKKLVDLLVDRSGARDEIKKRAGGASVQLAFGPGSEGPRSFGLPELVRLLSQPSGEATARPHVRLVRLHGEISLGGDSGGLLGGSSGIVARKVVERARALADDSRVRAVVLRIDSPGGSALGSDLAWIALQELRDAKPLVVSVGEMAALGGYYLASAASRIYAEPESIVGSIGVVGGKVSFGGTLSQLGIHTASFGDPRAAQLGSVTEPWDEATRARLLDTMQGVYDLFLRRIGEGRGKPADAFDAAVEGRVFGGERAKELGLVDELGGLAEALAHAKSAAGLDASAPVVVDDASSFFEALSNDDDVLSPWQASPWQAAAGATPELRALHGWLTAFARATSGGRPSGVATMLPLPLLVR